jgi:hypothetical protein
MRKEIATNYNYKEAGKYKNIKNPEKEHIIIIN